MVRPVPFQRTTDPATYPEPFTVNVKPVPPAATVAGLMLAITGGATMVNVSLLEITEPTLTTVTVAVPALTMSPEGTDAVSWPGET